MSVEVLEDDVDEPWETLYLIGTGGGAFEPVRERGSIVDEDPDPGDGPVYFERGAQIVALAPADEDPKPVATGSDPAVSRDAQRLAFIKHTSGEPDQLMIAGADGSDAEPVLVATGAGDGYGLGRPAWSPDGSKLAVAVFTGNTITPTADIAVVDDFETHAAETVFAAAEEVGDTLSYSPDGAKLAFDLAGKVTTLDIDSGETEALVPGEDPSYGPQGDIVFVDGGAMRILPDGGGGADPFEPAADGEPDAVQDARPAWAPDGTEIVFVRSGAGGSWIDTAPAGGGRATQLTPTSSHDLNPAWAAAGAAAAAGGVHR